MRTKTTTAITVVKHEMQLQEWTTQIEARQASGMSVQKWCEENGINPKTYYYHLRRVRERCVDDDWMVEQLVIRLFLANFFHFRTAFLANRLIFLMHDFFYQLVYTSAKFHIRRHIVKVYKCTNCGEYPKTMHSVRTTLNIAIFVVQPARNL